MSLYLKLAADPEWIDPFTGRPASKESLDHANEAMQLFTIFLLRKIDALERQLESGEITQEEFDEKMYLWNHPEVINNVGLPLPQEESKYGDQ